MKHIDRYISKQFITSFIFSLLAFIIIFILIDMMEKLDDFIDANAPTNVVVNYYLFFTPEIIKLMTPVAVLLGALFVTGRFSSQNELAAMKASGISLYRYMLPFFIITTVICLLSIYFNGWTVPYANQKRLYIERTHLHRGNKASLKFNLFFQVTPERIMSVNYYDSHTKTASRVSIIDLSKDDPTKIAQRFDAQNMSWKEDSLKSIWVLKNGKIQNFAADTSIRIMKFAELPLADLLLTPTDIEKKQLTPDEMNMYELKEFIANQKRVGQDVARWQVEYHFKIAFPFASIIMILFGIPFACNRPRTGAALGFGIAVAVTFLYLGFMKASQVFGYNGDLNPFVTAWLANFIFLGAGIFNLIRVQK
ncbi:MAG: LptF/LptG family permease [Bacteroidetes bacterium]|nr:LptF/LptG family permease [Bacteroidota bacterium]